MVVEQLAAPVVEQIAAAPIVMEQMASAPRVVAAAPVTQIAGTTTYAAPVLAGSATYAPTTYAAAAPVTYAAAPATTTVAAAPVTYAAAPATMTVAAPVAQSYVAAPASYVAPSLAMSLPAVPAVPMPAGFAPTAVMPSPPPSLTEGLPTPEQIAAQKVQFAAALDQQLKTA